MADPLWMKLRAHDWSQCGLAPADAKRLPKLLEALASRKEVRAMKASQQLWSLLKPGSPAAAAVAPFLAEIKRISTHSVVAEIEELEQRVAQPGD